jgi:hypothetical protein
LAIIRLLKSRVAGAKATASTGTRLVNDKALVRENERGGPDGSIRAQAKTFLGTTALSFEEPTRSSFTKRAAVV